MTGKRPQAGTRPCDWAPQLVVEKGAQYELHLGAEMSSSTHGLSKDKEHADVVSSILIAYLLIHLKDAYAVCVFKRSRLCNSIKYNGNF